MSENTTDNVPEPEEEEEGVVSLMDVIESQEAIDAQADAVLGASDDKNCTYSQGYLNRQAIYSCLTCIPDAKDDTSKCAGVCLACCLQCHDGHNLVELYTKRNFRCDCGNAKFGDFSCKLDENKAEQNTLNAYNHNFWGLYCTCKRPYPDEEDTVHDVMIQCIVCEDWYHTRHLGVETDGNNCVEVICEGCVKAHEFLLHYDHLSIGGVVETAEVDVVGEEDAAKSLTDIGLIDKSQASTLSAITECKMPKKASDKVCTKLFSDINWRQQLCTCVKCLQVYENEKVMFLIDPQDPVQIYESRGLERAEEQKRDQQEQLFKSIDRVPLLEMLAGYQELKSKLGEFLEEFHKNKRVVREQDVKEFFEEMKAKKRQRTGIQHFCR